MYKGEGKQISQGDCQGASNKQANNSVAEYGRIWQNMAEYGRIWQNMAGSVP